MPIELREIVFHYGDRAILDGFDAVLAEGTLTGVVGPSGVGKSTLLGLISGELHPAAGTIAYPGLPGGPHRLVPQSIGWIMQTTNVFPQRSVLDNVLLPAWIAGSPRASAVAAAHQALDQVGLAASPGGAARRCPVGSGSGWPWPGPWPAGPR